MEQRTVSQPTTRRDDDRQGAVAQRVKKAIAAMRRRGGAGPWAMPSGATHAKKGHHVAHWRLAGRRELVTRAIALGLIDTSVHRQAVGERSKAPFLSWKALASAVERAEARNRAEQAVETALEMTEGVAKVAAARHRAEP